MKEIIFKQRPELSEEASSAEKSILSRGNSKYRSPEVGLVRCVQRTSKKASRAEWSCVLSPSPQDYELSLEMLLFLYTCLIFDRSQTDIFKRQPILDV